MSKHTTSKGQRISCKPLVKGGQCAITFGPDHRTASAMRAAFEGICIKATDSRKSVVGAILTSLGRNAGNHIHGRGWTANITARTQRALTASGVFA